MIKMWEEWNVEEGGRPEDGVEYMKKVIGAPTTVEVKAMWEEHLELERKVEALEAELAAVNAKLPAPAPAPTE